MAKSQVKIQPTQVVWRGGLSLDDFFPPSHVTEIARVAQAVVEVTMNLQDVASGMSNESDAPEQAETQQDFDSMMLSALADWQSSDDDQDFSNRKTLWPQLDADQYRPAVSEEDRVKGNIAAIRLIQELSNSKAAPDADQTATLMRYCGWGGLARILGPSQTLGANMQTLRAELEQLTSPDEYQAIVSSVNTAFYTEPALVSSIWNIIQRMGFKGGRVCEPSAGVGHFVMGMPRDLALRSEVTAVELDKISAQILETCFAPHGVQVHACGLENAMLPHAFFDVVIGNIPFGSFKTNDTSRAPYADWSIHNWFIAKSIEMVRPGGLVAVISSRHALDSKNEARREWLAQRAELVGSFRLPTMTFKAFANTEAVTDLLVFKRRELPDFNAKPLWVGVTETPQAMMASGEENWQYARYGSSRIVQPINAYYQANQNHVIGKLQWQGGQYEKVAAPVFGGCMAELIDVLDQTAQAAIKENQYKPCAAHTEISPASAFARYRNISGAMPGSFVLSNGRLCISEGEELLDMDDDYTGTARKRIIGMMDVRDKALEVVAHQAVSQDDDRLKELQVDLNGRYDNFVAQCGALSTSANARVMRGDPNWPIMLALEIWDDEEQKAVKADIFHKRTVGKVELPTHVDSTKDAMLISLALHGRIVLKDMAIRTGKPVMEVVTGLKVEGLAYRDPTLARWVPADEYLSGHIGDKLAAAQAAGSAYEENVNALTTVMPEDLGPAEVEARLGASWISPLVIEQFATELVKMPANAHTTVKVSYDPGTATWSISAGHSRSMNHVGDHTMQVIKWGTSRRCALELLQGALNQQPPTVSDTVDGRQLVNQKETLAAREKWQAIRDHFRQWVYLDDDRRDALLRIYNDTFNKIVTRKFDGSHLHLPGMAVTVKPYAHQKDVIWRILVSGNTLLAHAVGAGKTLEMIAASMEMRRLGKSRKPLHVVLNHCLEQYVSEAVRLYPQARVLMATKNDLKSDKRRTFVARIATGHWDMVVMAQSTFERLQLSPEVQRRFIDQQLAEFRSALGLAKDRGAQRGIKEMERRMKEFEAKLLRAAEGSEKDGEAVYFDHLGIDAIFLDEAHAWKNLGKSSKMPRIAGMSNTASNRAFDVFMKTRVIMEGRNGAQENVIMATATPITNSIAEMHTMQVYLQPNTLKKYGIYEFDAWSANFGEAVTGMELAPDGSGFRTNTRYAKFVNMPELMSIFKEVADIKTKTMLKLPTPLLEGGGPQTVVVKSSDALKALTQSLVERAEKVRSGTVDPKDDNMLAITNDGRRGALDIRLVNPAMPADAGCKLEAAANNIFRIWEDGKAKRLTQLVFSDIGTPGASGFSVYEDVRERLLNLGIPREEIEFIHDHESDAAKAKLFKKARDGAVRVLFGSTSKLGTGTNVQTRLTAVHQLDAPWRPSDVSQRDGRADRQGNLCESIGLWRYVTEASFDAYSWQTLATKAKFIEQIMTAGQGLRTMEDISTTALSYAEIKALASGNPMVLEKATVDLQVQKLSLSLDHWEQDRWRTSRRVLEIKNRLAYIDRILPDLEKDVGAAKAAVGMAFKASNALSRIAVQNETVEVAIGMAFKLGSAKKTSHEIGLFGEYKICLKQEWLKAELEVTAPHSGLVVTADRPAIVDLEGVGLAALKAINSFTKKPDTMRVEYKVKSDELVRCEGSLKEGFDKRDELNAAIKRQNEIEASLDLDKDTEGSQGLQEEAA